MNSTQPSDPANPARRPRRIFHHALDTFGWTTAAGIMILLLSTGCPDVPLTLGQSEVRATAREGATENTDTGSDSASAQVGDARASGSAGGTGTIISSADVEGASPDSDGEAEVEGQTCYEFDGGEGVTAQVGIFAQLEGRLEVFSADPNAFAQLNFSLSVQKNDDTPIALIDETALLNGGASSVTTSGEFLTWTRNIPGRFGASRATTFADLITLERNDRLQVYTATTVFFELPDTAEDFDSIEGDSNAFISPVASENGLTQVPCVTPQPCVTDADCQAGEFCDNGFCVVHDFASEPLNFSATTNPNPPIPGQFVGATFQFDVHEGDLLPQEFNLHIPGEVVDFLGFPTGSGQSVGSCVVGGTNILAFADGPNAFYIDVTRNVVRNPEDPTGTIIEDASGNIDVQIVFPSNPSLQTIAVDTTLSCGVTNYFVFKAGGDDNRELTGDIVSVDPTSPNFGPISKSFTVAFNNGAFTLTFAGGGGDRDGDGTPDDQDGCPDDPNKIAPGICLCGTPDTDSDGDGASDCLDGCPNDPNKIDPGFCGCGLSDTGDSDGDGTKDCSDGCPSDPNKTQPGLCGCGRADDQSGHACDLGLPGICDEGVIECNNGSSFCRQLFSPRNEVCNAADDNCDGGVDEGDPGGGGLCLTGLLGVCRTGIEHCSGGRLECQPDNQPSTEVCNGADDDCNGIVDDTGCVDTSLDRVKGTFNLKPDPNEDKITIQDVFSSAGLTFNPATEGVALSMVQGSQVIAEVQIPSGAGWKINKQETKWTFKDTRDGSLGDPTKDTFSLQCNVKKQTCTVKMNIKEIELAPVAAGDVKITLRIGNDRFINTQAWRQANKKGTTFKTP